MTSKKTNKREIPIKNYFILGLIIVITLLIVLYSSAWYKNYHDSKEITPVITSTLREVKYDNIDTVLTERDVVIMYMCTTNETICRSFEKKFAKYIKSNNLQDDIMYLNLGYDTNENNLLNLVYDNYKSDKLVKKMHDYPTLVIFKSGEIVDILSSTSKNKITINKVREFLDGYDL